MTENPTSTEHPAQEDEDDTQGHVFIDTFIDPRTRDKLAAGPAARGVPDASPEA